VVDRPPKPTKDHQLGRPLPHQQPNPAQAHFKTAFSLYIFDIFILEKSKFNYFNF